MPVPTKEYTARKTITLTGAAGAGAVGTVSVFTVSGDVEISRLVAKCTTNLTEAAPTATIICGVASDTDAFIDVLNAVDLDANEFWVTGSAAARATGTSLQVGFAGPAGGAPAMLANENIIITVAAQNVTAGVIEFTCLWRPISVGASVVAA